MTAMYRVRSDALSENSNPLYWGVHEYLGVACNPCFDLDEVTSAKNRNSRQRQERP
jgi:hypothetical protein